MTARPTPWFWCTALLLAGCAGGPDPEGITDEYFFPLAPDPPRVQYLRSFSGSRDLDDRKPLLEYLAGAEDDATYEIFKAFSVATWKGRIYVTDSYGLQGLSVFDLEKRQFYILGKSGPGGLRKPICVSVDEEGYKYVCDLARKRVLVFGPDDVYVRTYGDGTSFKPVACVAYGDEVFILDSEKDVVENPETDDSDADLLDGRREPLEVRRDQILVLDKATGQPLRRIGQHGRETEGFSFASFLAVDRLGNLYVSDFLNYRIVKLDREGNVLAAFGNHGDAAGDFAQMKGVAVDPDGLIYVVDAAFQLVQVFDNAGQPLFPFGGPRAPHGAMDLPAGIWIDTHNLEYFRDLYHPDFEPQYLVLVANQLSRGNKVTVYAFGKRKGHAYPGYEQIATLDNRRPRPLWQMPIFPPEVPESPAQTAPTSARQGGVRQQ